MADPQVLNTLRNKRDDIEAFIVSLDEKVKAARIDLAHINAVIRLYEVNGEPLQFPVHAGLARLFSRGEIPRLCHEALAKTPEGMTTRDLALYVVTAKGMDASDKVLKSAVAYRIVNVLRREDKQGRVQAGEKRKGVRVWIPCAPR